MSSPVPASIPVGAFTESRSGIVVSMTPNSLLVNVGNTIMEVAFTVPPIAGAVTPFDAGTVVHLIRQDATWVCTGRLIGSGSNSVLNPSFEDSAPGTQPVNWNFANISGVATASTLAFFGAPDGNQVARVYSGVTSVSYLYSNPIAVTAGDIWSVAASVGADYAGSTVQTADAALIGTWYANATDLYPTVSSVDSVIAVTLDIPQSPPFRTLFGNVTAPVTGFLRVALQSNVAAGQTVLWDAVSARKA